MKILFHVVEFLNFLGQYLLIKIELLLNYSFIKLKGDCKKTSKNDCK